MKSLVVLLLLGFLTTNLLAQDDDIPIPPKRSKMAKIGGFGAFTPSWLKVNVDPFNEMLVAAGAAPLKDKGVVMLGGAGSIYIVFVPNLRIGGMGLGGSTSSTSLEVFGSESVRRDAELGVGFGGVTVEYVIPIVERLDVAVGGMLGGGGIDLTLRTSTGAAMTWTQEWANYGSSNYQPFGVPIDNVTRTLSGSYFIWAPSLNMEYAIVGWVAVRAGVSYVGMSSPSWRVDGEYDLLGVPSDITGKGVMLNLGIMLGTF